MKRFALLVVCLSIAKASADCDYFIPYDGLFQGALEVLYWRPSTCDFDYAIADERTPQEILAEPGALPTGNQHTMRPIFDCGFRVLVGYVSCDCQRDAHVQYSGLHQRKDNRDFPQDGCFWVTFGAPTTPGVLNRCFADGDPELGQLPGAIVAQQKLDFDAVDLEIATRLCLRKGAWGRFFGGLTYVYLEELFVVDYQGFLPGDGVVVGFTNCEARVLDRRRTWAVGPQGGAEVRIKLWCGFGLSSKFALAILAGETRGNAEQDESLVTVPVLGMPVEETSTLSVLYRERCQLMPHFSGRTGINWTVCAENCFQFVIEFGYELQSYVNALARPAYCHTKSTESTSCLDFRLDGFYLMFHLQM